MPELFDTGLSKIKLEIKSRLANHGLFATMNNIEIVATDDKAASTTIDVTVKGRTASRSFDDADINACCLRVGGPVLAGVIAMVDELSG